MDKSKKDKWLIFAAAHLRSISIGMIAVLLAIYLMKVGLSKVQVGLVISSGLLGASLGTFIVTFLSDYCGRKKSLIIYALLSAVGAFAVCLTNNFYAILAVSFLGMINARGKDRGPAIVLETSLLPSLVSQEERTKVYAWFYLLLDIGLGIGAILAGLPTILASYFDINEMFAFQLSFGLNALLMLITAFLYLPLSEKTEVAVKTIKLPLSKDGKKTVTKFAGLFALDGLAGGFLTSALLAFYFYERFDVPVEALGFVFFAARSLNAISHLVSAWVAKWFGLVNTMVYANMISHVFLILIAFAPTFPLAVMCYLLRETFSKMEGPTKRSYMMAIVAPEERMRANGITAMVRIMGWAVAPAFAGFIMQEISLASPLLIGAAMKISYDLLIYVGFSKIKPPEELAVSEVRVAA